jgi:hypothetical protein
MQGVRWDFVGAYESIGAVTKRLVQHGVVSEQYISTGHGTTGRDPLFSSGAAGTNHEAVSRTVENFCRFYDERLFEEVVQAAADEIKVLGFEKHVAALRVWRRDGCLGAMPGHGPLATNEAVSALAEAAP